MKFIDAQIKNVYGNEMIYIVNADEAKAVSMLTGKKTIDSNDINALFMLGIQINIINN